MKSKVIIHPVFDKMHLASLYVETGETVHITPQVNSTRRIVVKEGYGLIVLTETNEGGVCRFEDIIDVPEGFNVQITNTSEKSNFSVLIIQTTPLNEDLFKTM